MCFVNYIFKNIVALKLSYLCTNEIQGLLSTQLTLYKLLCTFITLAGSAPYPGHRRRFFTKFDVSIVEKVVKVFDNDVIEATRQMGTDLGFLVGISLGANVWAANRPAENIEGNIATVLSDRAGIYFSTALL